ncbi:NADPH-dependent 7-cyano-7-deazaguanine reductase QueF [Moraxella sp. Tifton1]|uniref:NADPH-dependent 7-cyano-7-deazaguanine reductase QueF n=1 Tax=Moraxella oculi TaxID=2940516 RepID=UPI002012E323|nr:NADPH-dependent 7-cyano-7-deazaguanine reductase QueF [Moraxella sp. Tifton1]MCL1623590.1 NADPH-dependent 7-cyano-7-deazaguanine reductase QueF [Moraxella sp. Tifton1]
MNTTEHLGVLGEVTSYPKTYDPSILFPISRSIGRNDVLEKSGFDLSLVQGIDVWQAFEISWLNALGVSQVAMARFIIPANSPNIVESKSLKLYLNGLNFTKFDDVQAVQHTIEQDLSACVGMPVQAQIISLGSDELTIVKPVGICIDEVLNHQSDAVHLTDDVDVSFLKNAKKCDLKTHQFYSHLLRSNCPVTNQPDWGTLQIHMTSPHEVDHGQVLRYVLSFRQHNGFHEQCVERIFADLMVHFKPNALRVSANYTRRGGIDINPVRVFGMQVGEIGRLVRQ